MRTLAAVLALTFCPVVHAAAAPPSDAERIRLWQEDLEVFAREVPRVHKNASHALPAEELARGVETLRERLPALDDAEVKIELARLVARIGDGHTHMNFSQQALGFHGLPIRFGLYGPELVVQEAMATQADLLGWDVTAIGGVPVAEALARVATITSADNDSGRRHMLPAHAVVCEALYGLGLTPAPTSVTLELQRQGAARRATLDCLPIAEVNAAPMTSAAAAAAPPLYRQRPDRNFWYEYLPTVQALYVKYNQVYWQQEAAGEYTSPGAFFARMLQALSDQPIARLILDVRDNGGGNNRLNLSVVHELIRHPDLCRRGKLFVIIGPRTFSAAQNFVNAVETHTQALFAGEPTGGSPNHFGDPQPVRLPNSGIEVRVSTLWWQDAHPADDRSWTAPQIAVEPSFADFVAGRDPVLDAVLAFELIDRQMEAALASGGIAAMAEAHRRFGEDPRHRWLDTETDVNDLGYRLLRAGNPEAALAVFRLNVEAHPRSANALDSLGEALLAAGQQDEAVRAYERALALEPFVPYRREVLERAKAVVLRQR